MTSLVEYGWDLNPEPPTPVADYQRPTRAVLTVKTVAYNQ